MLGRILSKHTWAVLVLFSGWAAVGGYLVSLQPAVAASAAALTALVLTRTPELRRRLRRTRFDADTGVLQGYRPDLSPARIYPLRRQHRPNG